MASFHCRCSKNYTWKYALYSIVIHSNNSTMSSQVLILNFFCSSSFCSLCSSFAIIRFGRWSLCVVSTTKSSVRFFFFLFLAGIAMDLCSDQQCCRGSRSYKIPCLFVFSAMHGCLVHGRRDVSHYKLNTKHWMKLKVCMATRLEVEHWT